MLAITERDGQRCGGPVLLAGLVVGFGVVELASGPLGQTSRFSLELLILLVLQLMGVLFKRQLKKQRGFVEKKRAKKTVTPAERLGSRIQQAEFATLMASFGVVVLLAVLIWFSLEGWVTLSNAIVLFLALRIQNTTFSSVSSSLMRFARAKANSF